MKLKDFSRYFGVFILGTLLISVYKTFDNWGMIWGGITKVTSALTPFIFGAGIAFLLYAPSQKLEGLLGRSRFSFVRDKRRGIGVVIILLAILLIIAGIIWLFVPILAKSVFDLVGQFPMLWRRVLRFARNLEQFGISAEEMLPSLSGADIAKRFDVSNLSKYAQGVWAAGSTVFNLLMSLIIAVYILLDRKHIKIVGARLVNLFIQSEEKRQIFYKYTDRAFHYMNAYVYCKLIDALIIGVASFIILLPFKVPYLPLMALMLGLFNLIPYFGAIIACVITALLTMVLVSPMRGVWVLVILIVLQQIDANIIQPKLVNETMDIKPLWVIFAILLFGALFGIWGILLGVPVMALILSAAEDIIRQREARELKTTIEGEEVDILEEDEG